MTPEFNSEAAHEAYAPLHWMAEELDFWAWSEDDESLTDGEDLQFLLDGELEDKEADDVESWDGYDSSSEEEEDDESTEEDPTAGSFLRAGSSDEDDDGDDGRDSDDGADSDDSSSSDDGNGDDGSDRGSGDSNVGASLPMSAMKSFSFSLSLKSRSTRSRWQRIGFSSNSVDPNRDLDQLHLPLVPETSREQIQ
jgi:hypothetical protein